MLSSLHVRFCFLVRFQPTVLKNVCLKLLETHIARVFYTVLHSVELFLWVVFSWTDAQSGQQKKRNTELLQCQWIILRGCRHDRSEIIVFEGIGVSVRGNRTLVCTVTSGSDCVCGCLLEPDEARGVLSHCGAAGDALWTATLGYIYIYVSINWPESRKRTW